MISEVHIEAPKLSNKGKAKYEFEGETLFVEQLAQKYYQKQGYQTLWAENDFWWTVITLLFWDVFYVKIDGVWNDHLGEFPSQFQDMPSDMFSSEFYSNREKLIENRLKELQQSDIGEKIQNAHKRHFRTPARLIENWDKFSIEDLTVPLKTIPKEALLKVSQRFLSNINYNRAGFPDLIVFDDKELFFVEVKGENDKVSEKQEEWMSFLNKNLSLKVVVLWVNPKAQKIKSTSKQKANTQEITVSFGKSSSQKREQTIDFIQSLPTFSQSGEGGDTLYSATFNVNTDIEDLFTLLDFTSGWKTQEILVDGKKTSSGDIRSSLWCYQKKEQEKASMDYCRVDEYTKERNKYGCNAFSMEGLDHDHWDTLGYIDTEKEVWIFDKAEIEKVVNEKLKNYNLCPHFDSQKILELVKAIPQTIDPKKDRDWAFLDDERREWFWDGQKWATSCGDKNFLGISRMIGILKISEDIRTEAKEYEELMNDDEENTIQVVIETPTNNHKGHEKKPFYKTWWFILILVLLFLSIFF